MKKFQLKVKGKDSVTEAAANIAATNLEATGKFTDPNHLTDGWDGAFEKEYRRLMKLVEKFVQDGEGGDDSVTLEFDMQAKTCVVVPLKKVKK